MQIGGAGDSPASLRGFQFGAVVASSIASGRRLPLDRRCPVPIVGCVGIELELCSIGEVAMLRMSVETKLTPEQVIEKATHYFGSKGLKLDVERVSVDSGVFTGGGGFVSLWAGTREGKRTEVILERREWEYDTRHFAETIG